MKLPSGREVDLHEITFGDHLDAQDAAQQGDDPRLYTLHILRTATGFSDDELRSLKAADGRALDAALKREIDTGSPLVDTPSEKPSSRRSRPGSS